MSTNSENSTEQQAPTNPIMAFLDRIRGVQTPQAAPPVEAAQAPAQQGAPQQVAPQQAVTIQSIREKISSGQDIDALSLIEIIEAQNRQIEELGGSVREVAQHAQSISASQITANADVAARHLSSIYGTAITRQDVLLAAEPMASYLEQEYGASAGNPQSLIHAFQARSGTTGQVQSKPTGQPPVLATSSAGAAPAATLKERMAEAFRKGLQEK